MTKEQIREEYKQRFPKDKQEATREEKIERVIYLLEKFGMLPPENTNSNAETL